MTYDPFLLETHDQERVVVHHWEPRAEARGVVNLVHGLAEHGKRYGEVAEALIDAGYAVYIEDHRGHGDSAPTADDLGFFAADRGWARVLDDLHRLTHRARREHPDVPVFLLGQSMGSLLAQQYLFTFPTEIDGLVLSASRGPLGGPLAETAAVLARAERLRLGPRGRSTVFNQLTFGAYNKPFEPARTPFDWLSRDPDRVDAYIADPRCGFIATTQLYVDLFSGLRVIGQPSRLRAVAGTDLPLYLLAGSEDPFGGVDGTAALVAHYRGAGMTRVEQRIYDGGRHELFNEINRDEVVGHLLGWLGARLAEHHHTR